MAANLQGTSRPCQILRIELFILSDTHFSIICILFGLTGTYIIMEVAEWTLCLARPCSFSRKCALFYLVDLLEKQSHKYLKLFKVLLKKFHQVLRNNNGTHSDLSLCVGNPHKNTQQTPNNKLPTRRHFTSIIAVDSDCVASLHNSKLRSTRCEQQRFWRFICKSLL